MKKVLLISPALVLAAVAAAHAAVQAVAMPSMPLSLPARAGIESVQLPTVPMIPVGQIILPGRNAILPTSLPSVPQQLPSIHPGVVLPGPLTFPGHRPLRIAILRADGQQDQQKGPSAAEQLQERARELDRLYDHNQRQIADDRHYTLPERDLLDEIGVGHHYHR